MAERVIALSVGNASIPIYREDWSAVKKAVEKALDSAEGRRHQAKGDRELVAASCHTVASRSRLTEGAGD